MQPEITLATRTLFVPPDVRPRNAERSAPPVAEVAATSPSVSGCPAPYPKLVAPRYYSLDAWRGLACLMLIVVHASFSYKAADTAVERAAHPLARAVLTGIQKLSVGVPMFFVISGYCVSATTDSSRRRSHSTADYFKRRFRRILPPYWAALAVTLLIYAAVVWFFPTASRAPHGWRDGAVPTAGAFSASQWFGNWTITEQWRSHLFGSPLSMILPPTWTLCYEEQFYALCGLLLLLMPGRFFLGTVLLSMATAGVYAAELAVPRLHVEGFFFDGRWLMFAAGVLLYYGLNYQGMAGRWSTAVVLGAGVALSTLVYKHAAFGPADTGVRDVAYCMRIAGVYALLLIVLSPLDLRIARAKLLAPLALCGQMCYSLYLIHWPVAKLIQAGLYHAGVRGMVPTLTVTVPLVLAASLLAGWAFHRLVERPFMNPRRTVNAC